MAHRHRDQALPASGGRCADSGSVLAGRGRHLRPFGHRESGQWHRAHRLEGAFVAACAPWVHGKPPLLVHLDCDFSDYPHCIAVFRKGRCWGAISKTNGAVLRHYPLLKGRQIGGLSRRDPFETRIAKFVQYPKPEPPTAAVRGPKQRHGGARPIL